MNTKGFLITFSFAAAVGITFLGLYYNIQTVVLNEEMKSLKRELWRLKRNNTHLEIEYLSKVKAESLQDIASNRLGMIPEREGDVIHINIFDQ